MAKRSDDDLAFDPASVSSRPTRNAVWYRALRRLEAGERAVGDGDGYAIGRMSVPSSVMQDLLRHDMVESAVPGRGAGPKAYVISRPGRAFLQRLAAARTRRDKRGQTRRMSGGRTRPHSSTRRDRGRNTFRAQHQLLEAKNGAACQAGSTPDNGPVLVNRAESPLGWLRHRKGRNGKPFLSAAQFEAGEELRKDFELAGMMPRMTTDLSGRPAGDRYAFSGQRLTATELQIAAKQRLDRAIAAVGPGLSDVAVRVCCFLEGIEAAERELGWPTRSGKLVLGIALDRLARHYGLT